jgi:hypothetical protein
VGGWEKGRNVHLTKELCLEGAKIKRFAHTDVTTSWKCIVFTFYPRDKEFLMPFCYLSTALGDMLAMW